MPPLPARDAMPVGAPLAVGLQGRRQDHGRGPRFRPAGGRTDGRTDGRTTFIWITKLPLAIARLLTIHIKRAP